MPPVKLDTAQTASGVVRIIAATKKRLRVPQVPGAVPRGPTGLAFLTRPQDAVGARSREAVCLKEGLSMPNRWRYPHVPAALLSLSLVFAASSRADEVIDW